MKIGIVALHMDPWRSGVDASLYSLMECWRGEHELTLFHSSMNPAALQSGVSYVRIPAIPCYRFNIEAASYALQWRRRLCESGGRLGMDVLYGNHLGLGGYDALTVQFCAHDYLEVMRGEWLAQRSVTDRMRYLYRQLEFRITARIEKRVLGSPDIGKVAVHAVSRSVAEAVSSRFPRVQPVVIPNPVDLSRFEPGCGTGECFPWDEAGKCMQWAPAVWRMLFVGGGWERKGLASAIRALRYCNPSVVLAVVGKGPVSLYRSLARRWGVEQRVHFAGPRQDVADWFRGAHLFVFPSTYEAMPIVCIEALAAGLPVLCAPFKGTEMFLQEGVNGFVVASDEAIGERVEILRQNAELHATMREAARRKAGEFAAPVIARRMMAFLESARPDKRWPGARTT